MTPDLITFAKGSNSGYVPIGGVIISDAIAATFDDRVFPGGLTYSGHPLAAASVVASITAMRDEGIVEHAARIGEEVLGPGLAELAERHPVIGEVRGLGVFWALDLVSDRETRAMLAPYGGTSEAMTVLVRGLSGAGPAAVRQLQPAARGAALHRHGGRGRGRAGDPRRGAHRRRPLLRGLTAGAARGPRRATPRPRVASSA